MNSPMDPCEMCDGGEQSAVVAIVRDLSDTDSDVRIVANEDNVRYVCTSCAGKLVDRGIAREMPHTEHRDAKDWEDEGDQVIGNEEGSIVSEDIDRPDLYS